MWTWSVEWWNRANGVNVNVNVVQALFVAAEGRAWYPSYHHKTTQFWTILNNSEQFWTILNNFEQIWTVLNPLPRNKSRQLRSREGRGLAFQPHPELRDQFRFRGAPNEVRIQSAHPRDDDIILADPFAQLLRGTTLDLRPPPTRKRWHSYQSIWVSYIVLWHIDFKPLYYIILYYITLYYIVLCYITLYHIMSYYVILCHIMSYYVILCHITLYCTISYNIISYDYNVFVFISHDDTTLHTNVTLFYCLQLFYQFVSKMCIWDWPLLKIAHVFFSWRRCTFIQAHSWYKHTLGPHIYTSNLNS